MKKGRGYSSKITFAFKTNLREREREGRRKRERARESPQRMAAKYWLFG